MSASELPASSDGALLRAILEYAPLSVIAYDDQGRVVLWNAEAERLLGWRASDVVGRPAPFPLGDAAPGEEALEISRPTRAGKPAQLSVVHAQLSLAGGAPVTVELGTDLGDRKRLEAKVVQGVRLEAVARLAGGIAHDFNNILAAIKCSGALVMDTLAADDPRAADVRAIGKAADRAAKLTRHLLAFTRQQVLVPTVLDLNDVPRAAERMLRGLLGDAIELVLDLAAAPVPVRADASQLEQALIHLVVNAREAMPEGGRVVVATASGVLERDPTGGEVPIVPRGYGSLAVHDSGRGIPRALHGRIFEPFYTTKQRGSGTGLGLSAVYGIVKQSGGYTFVSSEAGAGAAFTIYLPLSDAPPLAGAPQRQERTVPHRETILLVEDEDSLRELMRRILERSGYQVVEARNGADALEWSGACDGAIDLVVTDLVMPTMGGREMAELLLANRPLTRVLFVSGFTDDDVVRRGIIAPGTSYLQKPFAPAALVAKIGEMLRGAP
jgi:two-component system, cell cycle sensor histidine kinase and response regulator CckA